MMMETKRMPKGWTFIGTNDLAYGNKRTNAEKYREINKFKIAIEKMQTLSYEDLEKKTEQTYAATRARENALLQAYENKMLKSKELIKEAQQIKKARNKENNKGKKKAVSA